MLKSLKHIIKFLEICNNETCFQYVDEKSANPHFTSMWNKNMYVRYGNQN